MCLKTHAYGNSNKHGANNSREKNIIYVVARSRGAKKVNYMIISGSMVYHVCLHYTIATCMCINQYCKNIMDNIYWQDNC